MGPVSPVWTASVAYAYQATATELTLTDEKGPFVFKLPVVSHRVTVPRALVQLDPVPLQLPAPRVVQVLRERLPGHGHAVAVQVTAIEQRLHQKRNAAYFE